MTGPDGNDLTDISLATGLTDDIFYEMRLKFEYLVCMKDLINNI